MEIRSLEELLNQEKYLQFLRDIGLGKYGVTEREEWLQWFRGNKEELSKILVYIGKVLIKRHYTVLYPIEMIVVPRYPFTKVPIVRWSLLQTKSYQDYEVNKIKEICSKLGNLINCGFLLRHFVLIDIDKKDEIGKKYGDIETKRGYHIIRYIPDFPAVEFKLVNIRGCKIKIRHIEIMSGSSFLGSHPLQSRYLEFVNGKVNVRSYKIISKECEYAFRSADLTPLKSNIEEVKEIIINILKEYGWEGYVNQIKIKGLEKEEISKEVPVVNPRESKFNQEALPTLGVLSYKELKEMLEKNINKLPTCVKNALFGSPSKGTRYFHLRLLLGIIPYFVLLDDDNRKDLVIDFAERTNSKRSEIREWAYHSKYFTGRAEVDGEKISTVSKYGIPVEAWSTFETLGYCHSCPLRETCLKINSSQRRKLIVRYIEDLLGV